MIEQNTKTQSEQILEALQEGRSLTFLDALNEFGCARIGARVFELKQKGYRIKTTLRKLPSRKRVASYSLERKDA
jgi:hypothetical protein